QLFSTSSYPSQSNPEPLDLLTNHSLQSSHSPPTLSSQSFSTSSYHSQSNLEPLNLLTNYSLQSFHNSPTLSPQLTSNPNQTHDIELVTTNLPSEETASHIQVPTKLTSPLYENLTNDLSLKL